MKISARNTFAATITKVIRGVVNAEVELTLNGGGRIVAIITISSVDSLGLAEGKAAYAIIKASSVMIGRDAQIKLSARNILAGTVSAIKDGAVDSEVVLKIEGGVSVVAIITKESVEGWRRGRCYRQSLQCHGWHRPLGTLRADTGAKRRVRAARNSGAGP